jgi:hypothetical protein
MLKAVCCMNQIANIEKKTARPHMVTIMTAPIDQGIGRTENGFLPRHEDVRA